MRHLRGSDEEVPGQQHPQSKHEDDDGHGLTPAQIEFQLTVAPEFT